MLLNLIKVLQIKIMKESTLYFGLGALMIASWGSYYLYNKLTQKIDIIELPILKKIIQEVKHQMLISCISHYIEIKKREGKFDLKEPQIILILRNELSKLYLEKEMIVLNKYLFNRESYSYGLKTHRNDPFLQKCQKDIIDMMQNAIQGKLPDLTVCQQALNKFTKQDLKTIYYDLSKQIAFLVYNCLKKHQENDPDFNPRNDIHFKNAIRSLAIYDFKVRFLTERGFNPSWGCPNENFFKMLQTFKFQTNQYRAQTAIIENAYNKAINDISQNLQSVTEQKLHNYFDFKVNSEKLHEKQDKQKEQIIVKDVLKQPNQRQESKPIQQKSQIKDEKEIKLVEQNKKVISQESQIVQEVKKEEQITDLKSQILNGKNIDQQKQKVQQINILTSIRSSQSQPLNNSIPPQLLALQKIEQEKINANSQ